MESKIEISPETRARKKAEAKKTDYNFLLKCMAGLTAAAFLTAGVLAIIAAKTSTGAGAAGFVAASGAVAGPLGALAAILAVAAIIAAACILPCLFNSNSSSVAYVSPSRPRFYSSLWQPTPFVQVPVSGSVFGHTHHNHHGHSHGSSAPVHTHGGSIFGGSSHGHSGTSHGHSGTSHGHSGASHGHSGTSHGHR